MTQQLTEAGITGITRADAEAISARRDEPAWLRQRRLDAWQLYEAMELPDPGEEEWRRTNVREMKFEPVKPLSASAPISSAEQLPQSIRSAWVAEGVAARIVQHDSDVVFTELEASLKAKGVILTDLHTAVRDHGDLVRKYLYDSVKPEEWKFLALNAAMWSGGCFLYVPKGVEVELPMQLSFAASSERLGVFPRTIIVAERDSKVTFVDDSVSPDGAPQSFVSGAVEIYIGDGANVDYYDINRWGENVYNFKTVRAIIGRDAHFLGMSAGIGSKLTKMRIDAEMPKSGGSVKLLGVTFGSGDQHFDYNTLQNHVGDHTISDLQFKSALTDSASLVWYGITRINPGASASEANQTSRNLLLSEHAKAAPIPILEIEAYDVAKCSHGATVGPVEESELFYLESRAIPREVAERMLVEGYFASVVDRVPNHVLRDRVMDAVLEKAGGSAGALTFDEVMSA